MPQLPGTEQRQQVNPTNQPLIPQGTSQQPFKDNALVLNTLGEAAQQWSDANDVMQYTDAKAKHQVAIAQIEQKASMDPNFKNTLEYQKQIELANKTAVEGIDNQLVASKAASEFEASGGVALVKIGADFRKKQLDYNKVQVGNNLDLLLQNKLGATTPAEAMHYETQMNQLLQENVNAGTLAPHEADKMLKDAQETAVKYIVYADPSTTEESSGVMKELRDPHGKYSFLPPDTRLKLIEEDAHRIFQNNQMVKKENEASRDSRFNNVFTKANEGTLTLNDLDAEMAVPEDQGGIPKKQLLDIRKSLQSRIKSDLEVVTQNNDKAQQYVDMIDNFVSDEVDRQKGREAIVNAFKDGILSPKEATYLNSLKRETEDIQWSREKDNLSSNNLVPFKNAVYGVIDWFRGSGRHNEKDAALAIKKILSGAANNIPLDDVTQQVLKEDRVNTTPDIKSFPKSGQRMIDPVTGVSAIVYPDGTIEVENGGLRRKPSDTSKQQ